MLPVALDTGPTLNSFLPTHNHHKQLNAMKVISPEEAAAHNAAVVRGGLIGGTAGLAVGFVGVLAGQRRYALIRNLTLPFRAFLVTSAGTFGFVIKAESASTEFQRAQNPMNFYQDSSQRAAEIIRQNNSAYERFMEWGGENRYKIVFASWMASMAVALAIVNRAPMSTSQKLVQARVYAQGLALVVLIVSAAFEMHDAANGGSRYWKTIKVLDPNDPEHKRIIEKKIHKEEYEGQDLWKGKFLGPQWLKPANLVWMFLC